VQTGFWWKKLKERDYLEDPSVDWGMGGGGGTEWIDLSRDRDRWRALVSAVINVRFT
jgi:hypothetical protein